VRGTLCESIYADATFTDAGVDSANRSHYARALKTFLVLYGTCMTRLFIRKPVLLMDKGKRKKNNTIARCRALRHPHEAFTYIRTVTGFPRCRRSLIEDQDEDRKRI